MCDQPPLPRLLLFVLLAVIASCASPSYLSWRFETTGFLGDYDELAAGRDGELPRVARTAGFRAGASTPFVVESPKIWRSDQAPLGAVSRDALTDVAKELEDRVRKRLDKRCVIVHAPAPAVLRVQLALTEDAKAWVVADTFTTASRGRTPRAFRRDHPIATEAVEFAAGARVEVLVTDATTGAVLLRGQSAPVVAAAKAEDASWKAVVSGFERVARELVRSLVPPAESESLPETKP